MRSERDDALVGLDDYWDAIVRGQRPPETIDPVLVEGIARTHALDDASRPDSTFVTRLEEDLMTQLALPGPPSVRSLTAASPAPNGHAPLIPSIRRRVAEPAVQRRWLRGHGALAQFAGAALLLAVLTAGLLAFHAGLIGSFWSFGSEDGFHAGVPAALVSPEATPSAGPIAFRWQTSGDPASPMDFPSRPAIAPDGSIWVPDGRNGRFQIFSPDGELIEVWGEPGAGDGQFNFDAEGMLGGYPQGAVAFDASGNSYVADTGNSRIQKFGPDRRFLLAWGSAGTGDGQFLGAADVVVDRNGRVYVVDGNRGGDPHNPTSTRVNSVQVFDEQGAFIASWGAPGNEPGQLSSPTGLAIDVDGNILVTDIDNSRIQRFTPEGAYLDGWGGFGVGQREFSLPIDVAVDPVGRIYVVDWSSNDVKVFGNDGRFLDQWSGTKYRDGQLNGPSGIAVDGQGGIYVTDNSGRLQKYQLGGGIG